MHYSQAREQSCFKLKEGSRLIANFIRIKKFLTTSFKRLNIKLFFAEYSISNSLAVVLGGMGLYEMQNCLGQSETHVFFKVKISLIKK
jgi:hypothetical protein